ncbi:MAG: VWA domain-containing protein [Acetatifactor sp.]
MELKYAYLAIISVIAAVGMLLLHTVLRRKPKTFSEGEKVYVMAFMKDNAYLKRRRKLYVFWSAVSLLALAAALISAGIVAAGPYKSKVVQEKRYSRDILLCMDISTTVDAMNQSLTGELIDTVRSFRGERLGIVIFNTSPVLVCPLTDDYEFVIEQLENISKALELRIRFEEEEEWDDDYFYWNQYISAGTLVGNEERGSSIIGDGLAATVYHFSERDRDRTRIVILTTDNEVYGTEIFDLPEAAKLCRQNEITVYGIGTKAMKSEDMKEMKASVELTGGKFYLEEEKETFTNIIEDIQSHSASLLEGDSYVVETGHPEGAFIITLIALGLMFLSIRILRK